jgi:hypothetical protein
MSFECRLAKFYVGREFRGCCPLTTGWRHNPDKPELALDLGTDQPLNDILVAAGQPLKPKSGSSSN